MLLVCVSLVFTGCLDIVEEVTLAAAGTGSYKMKMDMSGMFEMIEMLAAMDTSSNSDLKKLGDKNFDSSFQLKSMTDTATNLTAEQKRFFSRATGHMLMNAKDKKFVITMDFPFDKPEDIGTLTQMAGGGKGLGMLGKSAGGSLLGKGDGDDTDIPSFDIYDWKFTKNLMERKVNEQKYAAFKKDTKIKELGEAESMFGQMNMRTVIHLPAPAKKAIGDKVQLSGDKKTVTVNATFYDIIKNPSALAYRIEF